MRRWRSSSGPPIRYPSIKVYTLSKVSPTVPRSTSHPPPDIIGGYSDSKETDYLQHSYLSDALLPLPYRGLLETMIESFTQDDTLTTTSVVSLLIDRGDSRSTSRTLNHTLEPGLLRHPLPC